MLKRIKVLLLLACVLISAAGGWRVQAQDDWGAGSGGGSDDAAIIQRYKQMADRSDEESYAFKQMMKLVGGGGSAFDALVADYEAKAKAEPSNARWPMLLGHVLRHAGRAGDALKAYEAAAKLKETAPVFEYIGDALAQEKRFDDAISAYEKSLSMGGDKDQKERILRALGKIALDRRQFEKALGYFEQLVGLNPTNLFVRKELALLLADNRRFDDAITQLQSALKLVGSNRQDRAQLTLDIGDIQERAARFDEAIATYREAAKASGGDAWVQAEVEERVIGIYRKQNNIAGLLGYYKETWPKPSFDQLMILARLSEEVGLTPEALDYTRRAIKAKPSNPDAHLRLIQILEQTGDTAALVAAYEQLLRAAPREVRFRFELANLFERTQRRDQATKVLDQIAASFSKEVDVLMRVADTFMGWGLIERAIPIYKTLVKLEPDEPIHLEALGELYYTQGQQELALATWQKLLTVIPEKAAAHMVLGRVYVDHGMSDMGLESYRKAQEIVGDDPELNRDLAEALESAGRIEDSRQTWERLALSASDPLLRQEARARLVSILKRTGMLRASLADYQAKFDQTPPDLPAGLLLAEAHARLDELPQAATILEKIAALDPNHTETLQALEKVYSRQGELKKAIETLETLNRIDARRARVYGPRIIDHYLDLGDTVSAEAWIKQALGAGSGDAESLAKLGEIYTRRLHYAQAAESYEQAITADPLAFQHQLTLAELYFRLHRDADADRLLRQVVRGSPDEGLILKAARRAIDHNALAGTLANLEADFLPLLNILPARSAYREALIDLYQTQTQHLIARTRTGSEQDRALALDALRDIGRRALKPLLISLSSTDGQRKITVVEMLGELQNLAAAPALIDLLHNDSAALRIQAALSLGKLASPSVVGSVAAALNAGTSPLASSTSRELLTWVVGRTPGEPSVALLTTLTGDSSGAVRALAALGLGRQSKGFDALLKMHNRERIPDIQRAVTWALGQTRDPRAVQPLTQILATSTSSALSTTAAWALGNVADDPAATKALLVALWTNPHAEVRAAAAHALARFSSPALSTHSLWEENLAFIDPHQEGALVSIEDLVRELTQAGQRSVRADLNPFAARHGAVIAASLKAALDTSNGDDLLRLLRDLDSAEDSLGLSLTYQALIPGEHATTPATQEGLRAACLGVAAPKLKALLSDPDGAIRWHAASLLGKLRDKTAIDPLLALLSDPEPEAQRQAALALGRLADPRAIDPLLAALESQHFGTRANAAWALGLLKDPRVFDPLAKALKDPYPFVQGFAARGLGLLGDSRAIDPLNAHLKAADPVTQLEITNALAILGAR